MSDHFEDEKKGMPAVVRYTIVGIILAIFTAIEVAVLYPPLLHQGDLLKIVVLIGLSILKFVAVVALFMHLWHDPPLYTGIFVLGFVLAAGTMVALIAVTGVHPPRHDALKQPTAEEIDRIKQKRNSEHHSLAPSSVNERLMTYRRYESELCAGRVG